MNVISQHIKLYLFLYILVFFILLLRLNFQINYLEDWDSIQFALAIHSYSILSHQPHPPGYPLYILLGKLINIFFNNDLKTLTFISSLFSSLSIIPLYFLAKKMFNQITAIVTITLFIFIPLIWTLSAVALTDIPGLFFLLSITYLIYIARNNYKNFILVCLLAGLILGFRSNSISIIIALLFLVLLHKWNLKFALLSIVSFLCGIAIWLVPLIVITGLDQFLQSYSSISHYVIKHDALLGNNLGIKNILRIKIEQFWYLLQIGYTTFFSILSIIIIGYLFYKKKLWSEFRYQFLSIWMIAQMIPQFVFFNLEMPRHTLPLLPPILILVSSVLVYLIKRNLIFIFFFFLIITILFLQSWSQIERFKIQIPPTIQPIQYVKKNFNYHSTIVIAGLTYRHFQYYAPEYTIYQSSQISQITIPLNKIIIIDNLQLQDKIKNSNDFKIINSFEFIGDKDIFSRVSKTNLYILKNK